MNLSDPIPYGLHEWIDNEQQEIPYVQTIKETVTMEQWLRGKKRHIEEDTPLTSVGTIIT